MNRWLKGPKGSYIWLRLILIEIGLFVCANTNNFVWNTQYGYVEQCFSPSNCCNVNIVLFKTLIPIVMKPQWVSMGDLYPPVYPMKIFVYNIVFILLSVRICVLWALLITIWATFKQNVCNVYLTSWLLYAQMISQSVLSCFYTIEIQTTFLE